MGAAWEHGTMRRHQGGSKEKRQEYPALTANLLESAHAGATIAAAISAAMTVFRLSSGPCGSV